MTILRQQEKELKRTSTKLNKQMDRLTKVRNDDVSFPSIGHGVLYGVETKKVVNHNRGRHEKITNSWYSGNENRKDKVRVRLLAVKADNKGVLENINKEYNENKKGGLGSKDSVIKLPPLSPKTS